MEVKDARYVGIENENIYSIQYQLDSDEIGRFEELKRYLAITSDSGKMDEIRCKMAAMLGKEMDEEYSPKTMAKQEEKEEIKKEEVVKEDFGPLPDTLEGIRMEYDKINEELIKGNQAPELFERFLQLKQLAKKLQEQEKDETKVQLEIEAKDSNLEETELQSERIELRPEQEEPEKKEPKVKKWFDNIVTKIASRKGEKTNEDSDFDTYGKEDTTQFGEEEVAMEGYLENETFFNHTMGNDDGVLKKEDEIVDDETMDEKEYVSYEEIIGQEVEVSDEAIEEQFGEEEKEVPVEEDVKPVKQKEGPRKPFQEFTQEEMEKNIAKMVVEMLKKEFHETGITLEEVKTEKTGAPNNREKAIERGELRRKVKSYLKEKKDMEIKGHLVTDLPSKMILAEYELTGKLEKKGLIVTVDGLAFEMSEDGSVKIKEIGKEGQNPCEVSKKEQSQVGLGERGRSAGTGVELEF